MLPKGGASGIALKGTIEGFRAEGENWTLTAPRAIIDPDRGIRMEQPSVEVKRQTEGREERLTASADAGVYATEAGGRPVKRVMLSGRVRAAVAGKNTARIETESLSLDLEAQTARTDGVVVVTGETEEGRHSLRGQGAEIIFTERLLRILKDGRIEITGGASLFSEPAAKPQDDAPPVTRIVCGGPIVADGFRRAIALENGVAVEQGDSRLNAERMDARFPEKGAEPERLTAQGKVRFAAAGAEGRCDELVRTGVDKQIAISGKPAVVRQGANEIAAERIAMDVPAGLVVVPVAGRLTATQKDDDGAERRIVASWKDSLRFDRQGQKAVIRGSVAFAYGGRSLTCDVLTVRFDAETGALLDARAEGNVDMGGDIGEFLPADQHGADAKVAARASEIAYDPKAESLVLSGEARIVYGPQTISGDRIRVSRADGAVSVEGAGRLQAEQPGGNGEGKVAIDWKDGMKFTQSSGEAAFLGGVRVVYGGRALSADEMKAKLSEDGAGLRELDASGHVVLRDAPTGSVPPAALRADRVVARMTKDGSIETFAASGDVSVEQQDAPDAPQRTLKAAKVAAAVGGSGAIERLTATGGATLIESGGAEAERRLTADTMEARLEEGRLQRFSAEGTVVIVQSDIRAAGDELTWDMAGGKDAGVMTGAPVTLQRGTQRLLGDRVEFGNRFSRVRITSPARERVEMDLAVPRSDLRGLMK